jgi:hypothetical protein
MRILVAQLTKHTANTEAGESKHRDGDGRMKVHESSFAALDPPSRRNHGSLRRGKLREWSERVGQNERAGA